MFPSNCRILPLMVILTLQCLKLGRSAAGSEKDVHYWFMPTVGTVKEASELEVFHEYQPQCVKITTDMYPCNNLQYKSLRMPNLLGQSTIAEVKSFLNSFGDNKFLTCDQYAKHFLCSLVTPLCFDQKSQFKIPPCRSLCERVRDKCFYQLYENGLGIPGEFNCSKFENDNLCMDPTKGQQTTPMPDNIPTYPPNNYNNKDSNDSNNSNEGDKTSSHEDFQYATTGFKSGARVFNESDVHSALCYSPFQEQSTVVLRARIKSIREKRKGFFIKVQKKNLKVFYDRDSLLGEVDGVPSLQGTPLDGYFFRTFPKIQADSKDIPVKKDVVYFFISRIESDMSKGEDEQFFRVQFMIQDNGMAELRSRVNSALKKATDC